MKNNPKPRNKKEVNALDDIGEVAAILFNKKGYLETTMNEISAAAKLSKGGIHHYFPKKHDILFFILNKYMGLILSGMEKELEETTDSLSKIRLLISYHINYFVKNMSEGKILFHEVYLLPAKYHKIIFKKEKKYRQVVSDVLSDFLGNDVTKDELTALTFSLLGMCNWIYSWYNPDKALTSSDLVNIVSRLFCNGVCGYERSKRKAKRNPIKVSSLKN